MYKLALILLLVSSILQEIKAQSSIDGQIVIDTTIWKPIAYLSIIPDIDNINTMAYDMIIDQSLIDNSGRFSFKTQYLPIEDNLFRIHIAKKNDPPTSLIIGGRDENYILVIANNQSHIIIKDSCNSKFLADASVYGYLPNKMMLQVNEIASFLDTVNINGYVIKKELIKNAVSEKLRSLADSCSNPIVSLYALYKSNFEKNYPINQQFYRNFLSKWSKERSTYFIEFRKRIPQSQNNRHWIPFLIGGICLVMGVLLSMIYFKLTQKNQNLLRDLSIQERKIFALMIEGKSNKEISEIISIGLSTVKSHINSIYSKLGINSRKDVLNLNLDKKNKGDLGFNNT
ncbi:MAG: helix-turn-helix transcriptional regulator [Bacteroidales bacterium]|nr:helix-turn-helix transcriptional regulator [Bacteroidales bacterium]